MTTARLLFVACLGLLGQHAAALQRSRQHHHLRAHAHARNCAPKGQCVCFNIERQSRLMCGKHALNNLFGQPGLFDQAALNAIAARLQRELPPGAAYVDQMYDPDQGDYNIEVRPSLSVGQRASRSLPRQDRQAGWLAGSPL